MIIIAHRLSAVRQCDNLIALENGHIVERGTHEQLPPQAGARPTSIAVRREACRQRSGWRHHWDVLRRRSAPTANGERR